MDISTSSTTDPQNMYNYINGFFMNPSAFIILIVVIVTYLLIFLSLGGNSSSDQSSSSNSGDNGYSTNILMVLVIVVVTILIAINGIQYFFGIDIVASIGQVFSGNPVIDVKVNQTTAITPEPIPEIQYIEQVFNIPGNYYGYEDAKALCKAYGSRLATYDEVENAYNRGGEWCNYGWSENQMALFPTQKGTYDKLQTIQGHEHDCGRTGVNGGYIANPMVKFGVNCYGYKPKINNQEEQMMQNVSPYPQTQKDILMEQRVDYWKTKLDEILVSPFNYSTWSKI
jgi:hypothetical protein